jgi:hypothetical protein
MPEFSIVTAGQPKGLMMVTQQQKESLSIKSTGSSTHLVLEGSFPKDKVARHEAYQSPPHLKIKYFVELYPHCAKFLHGVVIG